MKLNFLITQRCPLNLQMEVLYNEYDYLYQNSYWDGEENVRKSKAYKIGKRIERLFKIGNRIERLFTLKQ